VNRESFSVPTDRTNPLPLYIQVREDIRGQIECGKLPLGQRLLSEDALMEQYNVSSVTVKRALRDLAKEGLLIRIQRKGTFVAPRNAGLAASRPRTKVLALIIPDIEDLFLSEIYRGLADVARQAGYAVSILSSDRQIDREGENIRTLGEHGEEGAAIFPNWGRANAEQIFELKRRQFPFVMVNRYFRDIQTHYVVADNRAGACEAVEHLVRLGHRRIGCIGWVECSAVEDRLAGYRLALGRHEIPYDEKLVRGILDEDRNKYAGVEPASGGYHEMKKLLRLQQRPTAIFAVSDRLAVGAMRAIAEAGLSVPDDVAMVGFDDVRYAADLGLSTVAQPAFQTGKMAADILLRQIEGQTFNGPSEGFRQVVLPTKLIIRSSCGGKRP
jgi:DNA-binding LacI/PurR family transcriptional regulator